MQLQMLYGAITQNQIDLSHAVDPWGIFKAYLLVADEVTLAVPGTASAPVLYNPPQSDSILQILRVHLGITGGTIVEGAIEYALQDNPTLSGLTLGPNPINMAFGKGNACRALWYKAATWAAAATVILPYGINATGANAAGARSIDKHEEGRILLYPGTAFAPCVASAAVAATVIPMVEFAQIPLSAVA